MRYDYFMIWGNGLNHVDEILDIIDKDENFKVILTEDVIYDNTEKFIKGIYECDTVPWDHLIAKSQYLMTSPKKAIFILTENLVPDEKHFGGGAFRHIQCQKVKDIKTIIRSKFNPPFSDTNKTVSPLPKGISHEHVIHGSDYESQVVYTLNFLGLPTLEHFKKFSNRLDVRRIISQLNNYTVIKLWEQFPNYMGYNDVDILVGNKTESINTILRCGEEYKSKGWKIQVTNNVHCHIDFIAPNESKLDFRFDLIGNINSVYKTNLKDEFNNSILSEKITDNNICVPRQEHDLILRYLEYKEHINDRPDKIKHLHYCEKYNFEPTTINKYLR